MGVGRLDGTLEAIDDSMNYHSSLMSKLPLLGDSINLTILNLLKEAHEIFIRLLKFIIVRLIESPSNGNLDIREE